MFVLWGVICEWVVGLIGLWFCYGRGLKSGYIYYLKIISGSVLGWRIRVCVCFSVYAMFVGWRVDKIVDVI